MGSRNFKDFKDFFSPQAQDYSKFRPGYPRPLFEYLSSICATHEQAWDCGTGTGQAAVELAEFFRKVIATDPSEKQLAHATRVAHVEYRQAHAEASGLDSKSTDLITVAQAFHWFNQQEFFLEASRVGKPGAKMAIWTYNRCVVDPGVDRIVQHLYSDILGQYWDEARKQVEDEYRGIHFPFEEEIVPAFEMKESWTLGHLVGYLGTWSSLQMFVHENGSNPLEELYPSLKTAWGNAPVREIRWPLSVRVFRLFHL